MKKSILITVCIFFLIVTMPALSQLPESASTVIKLSEGFRVYPNQTYHVSNNWEAKLDLYLPPNAEGPFPTLIYYHWGGWVFENVAPSAIFRVGGVIVIPAVILAHVIRTHRFSTEIQMETVA